MIRTTLLIYLISVTLSLSGLRYLFLCTLARKNASARKRGRFVRGSTAIMAAFHVLFVVGAGCAWGVAAAMN